MIIPRYATIRQDCGSAQHGTIRRHQGQKQEIKAIEYTDSLSVTNIDDMIEYLYSLSSMTSITGIPKQAIKDILIAHSANGILNVPKEYGMFIAS